MDGEWQRCRLLILKKKIGNSVKLILEIPLQFALKNMFNNEYM
jgi:hypothetical protein